MSQSLKLSILCSVSRWARRVGLIVQRRYRDTWDGIVIVVPISDIAQHYFKGHF